MGQRGMVERSRLLANGEWFAADLEHQGLGDGVTDLVGCGDPEACLAQSGHVLVGAGEGHRRVDGQRNTTLGGQRGQYRDSVGSRSMGHDRAAADGASRRKPGDQSRQFGIRNGQE